ncbi:hypothetical protein CAL12_05350 [Bordetella genomosp. 8]|uniref:DUF2846 domain-containing protein n=1 Tax=Bordetella genomosp. 8 TaxID=1416806 RepID=A0A1W6YID3_9BORD|nr:DUF2846 domain-containing protein [Bordetella genomosp. 8]ARP80313.1 hypothetical protein CAL12_05350 [Bordetella genomosp. 8]
MKDLLQFCRRSALLAAAAFLLAGCASHRYADVADAMVPMAPGEGRIVLYTPTTSVSLGANVQPRVRINNRLVGRAKPGGFFYLNRPAGSYTVLAQRGKSLTFDLAAGQTQYIRFVPDGLFSSNAGDAGAKYLRPELAASPTDAQAELKAMQFWGASSRTRNEEGIARTGAAAN